MQLFGSQYGRVGLFLFGSAWLAACGGSSAATSTPSAVDTAYAALVGDVASCAKQVTSCVDAAADSAARDACRAAFASCRDSAGQNAAGSLASAVTSCTSRHKQCAQDDGRGDAGSCEDDLNTCLCAAHPKSDDDADGGSDQGKRDSSDCLDELHGCVQASGTASTCADGVRQCVIDSIPSPSDVVPSDDGDKGGNESRDGSDDDSREHDTSAQAGSSGTMEHTGDAGVGEPKSGARECVDSFRTCVDSGSDARSCAKTLKDCQY